MSGKNLVPELNAKIISASEIAGFLNFNISKTIGGMKLQIKDTNWWCSFTWVRSGHAQACPKRGLEL